MRIVINPFASRTGYSEREALVISLSLAEQAYREIVQWPEYAVTPLRRLSGLISTSRVPGVVDPLSPQHLAGFTVGVDPDTHLIHVLDQALIGVWIEAALPPELAAGVLTQLNRAVPMDAGHAAAVAGAPRALP